MTLAMLWFFLSCFCAISVTSLENWTGMVAMMCTHIHWQLLTTSDNDNWVEYIFINSIVCTQHTHRHIHVCRTLHIQLLSTENTKPLEHITVMFNRLNEKDKYVYTYSLFRPVKRHMFVYTLGIRMWIQKTGSGEIDCPSTKSLTFSQTIGRKYICKWPRGSGIL